MLVETFGNIWDFHELGWVGITTNGFLSNGMLVMGAGIAKEAAARYPSLPARFASSIMKHGNVVCPVEEFRVFSFPTKEHWKDPSPIELIEKSCRDLKRAMWTMGPCFLVPPGCGLGGLDYAQQVRPILLEHFKESVHTLTIVDFAKD